MSAVTLNPHYSSINVETTIAFKKTNQTTNRFCPITFAQCEHAWSYIGKIAILSRHLMNAAANQQHLVSWSDADFPHRIKNISTHLKLLSIVSVLFSLADLISTAQRIFKSFLLKDKEGVALGALSFVIIAADTFDSITTFVNSALSIASLPPIEAFSAIGLPIAFAVAGMGTLSRAIQIAKALHLYLSIDQSNDKLILERKMKIEGLGILANLSIISGLILFSISAAGSVPFLLLALGFMIRISSLIYQET